mgnify:FL=1
MNFLLLGTVLFVIVYLLLNWFVNTSSKKISKYARLFIIFFSVFIAILMAFAGRYIFSLPFLLAVLPFIKTKAGISLLQIIRLWSLFKVLKNSGRFNFNNFNTANRNTDISLDEAYRILNLNPNKKYTKDEIINSYKKIMKKIHPDISPELSRLASIVNEAKDVIIKNIS